MHKTHLALAVTIIALLISFAAQAGKVDSIVVSNAYIRASIPGTIHSSAYMGINNNDEKTVTLVRVSSKISPRVEMHKHVMENGMMHMQKLQKIDIAANTQVLLQPHGLHLMFFDLVQPLTVEDIIEVTLHFSNKHRVIVSLPVKSLQ
jgi:copper(I)-binding protein